jgi:hypothetical protein
MHFPIDILDANSQNEPVSHLFARNSTKDISRDRTEPNSLGQGERRYALTYAIFGNV